MDEDEAVTSRRINGKFNPNVQSHRFELYTIDYGFEVDGSSRVRTIVEIGKFKTFKDLVRQLKVMKDQGTPMEEVYVRELE